MVALLLAEESDSLCDEIEAICGTCHFRYNCDYINNGEVSLCATVVAESEQIHSSDSDLNERLEECFERMLKKSHIRTRY